MDRTKNITLIELIVVLLILTIVISAFWSMIRSPRANEEYDIRTGTTIWQNSSGQKYITDRNGNTRPVLQNNQ